MKKLILPFMGFLLLSNVCFAQPDPGKKKVVFFGAVSLFSGAISLFASKLQKTDDQDTTKGAANLYCSDRCEEERGQYLDNMKKYLKEIELGEKSNMERPKRLEECTDCLIAAKGSTVINDLNSSVEKILRTAKWTAGIISGVSGAVVVRELMKK